MDSSYRAIQQVNTDTRSRSLELETALAAAQTGGEIVARYFGEGIDAIEKTVEQQSEGLVTKADLESEQAIINRIKQSFPDHNFLAEESFSSATNCENLWIIDPLDGTNNFAHGIPHFAVSVAYYRRGIGQCGVVFNPNSNERFEAEQGKGAFHDDQRVRVNSHSRLNQTMLATGFYYDRGEIMEATLAAIGDLFRKNIHGIRRFGAATLDLVDVGIGRYGGFFEFTLSPWDFAAAKLFVEEAGGKVTNCLGQPMPLEKSSLLATNGFLHDQMLDVIAQHASSNR